ncbi:heterokaryon incompatibility protein [Colletotrichum eremochloae]|nr:heterokaryon incompatibility protein [Colletotrichum eremochloae]
MSVAEINHQTRPSSIMSVVSDGTATVGQPRARPRPPSDSGSEQRRRENNDLCEVCQSLGLGVQSFKVRPGPSRASGGPLSGGPLHSSATARRLGSLQEMEARLATCALCALIVRSVHEAGTQKKPADQPQDEDGTNGQLQRATCFVSWEIDGREAASARRRAGRSPKNLVRGITRRMHIRWSHPGLSDAYLVYVAPDTFSRTASDADRVWVKDSLFLGRAITENIENQALIQSWLDLCRRTHKGPCCQVQDGRAERFVEMISHSYFGVIDVQNMQLTQLPCRPLPRPRGYGQQPHRETPEQLKPEPYVALSYVWGADPEAYTTRMENVMLHRTHGGLEEVLQKMPRAIRDAIDLTRRLGFRYVWVDRLCIVQNSARSWKLNAYNMDLIYGNAALTICAADGDAAKGLRAMRPTDRNTRQVRGLVGPQLELMVTRPPEIYIRASEWNERAWTFQERLLSRRCLIFTNGRVYFQCRSTGMSEDIFGDKRGAGWSLDLVDAPLQMFRQLDNRSVWVYMKCVELYTERKLTQAKDIQAAFSGMANLMEGRMRAPFIHGLPSSHFDLALLWEPIKSSRRRGADEAPEKASIPDFPSWSWTGWVGEVQYKEDLVSGILDNVSDWLDTRTWIEWWVRDGHGDLRPLWDRRMSQEDQSKESKWRGYTQRRASRRERLGRRRNEYEDDIDAPCGPDEIDVVVHSRPDRYVSPPRSVHRSVDDNLYLARYRDNDEDDEDDDDRESSYGEGSRDDHTRGRYPTRRSKMSDPGAPRRLVIVDASPPPPAASSSPEHPRHNATFYDMAFGGDREDQDFRITLRDYPYRVVKAPFDARPETAERPLLPILQFRTWHAWLYIHESGGGGGGPRSDKDRRQRGASAAGLGTGQARYHIADEGGDWCGSIVLDAAWAEGKAARQEFIAVSEAKSFTAAECREWTYYVPKERDQSEWDLFYVLLIERRDERWERVGVGKVFKEAFRVLKQKEIMLG